MKRLKLPFKIYRLFPRPLTKGVIPQNIAFPLPEIKTQCHWNSCLCARSKKVTFLDVRDVPVLRRDPSVGKPSSVLSRVEILEMISIRSSLRSRDSATGGEVSDLAPLQATGLYNSDKRNL